MSRNIPQSLTRQNSSVALQSLHSAIAALGGFAQSSMDGRHCSRCSRPLTDPASRQLGIGPICNALTTKLAASSSIPADYPMAILTAFRIPSLSSEVPDKQLAALIDATAKAVADLVIENAGYAAAVDGYDKSQVHGCAIGSDNRLIIQAVDTILSFRRLDRDFKLALIRLVKELGYVGVAGVMSGHGSTGPSGLTFHSLNGILELTGSRNKPGIEAIREACPKVKIGTYPKFTCRVSGHDGLKMIAVALEYWPMLEETNVSELTVQIKEWVAANPVVVPVYKPIAANTSVHTIPASAQSNGSPYIVLREIDSQRVGVTIKNFNWKNPSCPGMIYKIKAEIGPKQRTYDAQNAEWVVKMKKEEAVNTFAAYATQFGLELSVAT